MTVKEQIDYMILSLQIAKDEIDYAEEYIEKQKKDKDFYSYGHMGYSKRIPNGTLIRESLKMVSRVANLAAKKVTLSSYNTELFDGE
ncbi:MAG: hypothetical protein KHY19_09750 [Coprobacillus cateniformis]|mgnify:FL=1|jgi:hypothetical protein|nr:hypothetical protein [Coprobacillus cateniformis]